MSEDGAERTALKLKVRNRESGLLEWRPCVCTIAQDQLVLEPSLGSDSDDEGNGAGVGRTTPIIRVDLASQLQHIELKRKNKARCEFIYTTSDGGRASEELMAPSAKICQQWVDQVRDAQQCAQRQASIRKGAMMAQFRAASVSPLPANMGVGSGPTSQQPGDMLERASFTLLPNDLVVKECSNAMAATDNESSTVSSDPFQPLVMVNNTNALDASVSSSGVSYTLPTDQLKRFQASNHSQERRHESDNEVRRCLIVSTLQDTINSPLIYADERNPFTYFTNEGAKAIREKQGPFSKCSLVMLVVIVIVNNRCDPSRTLYGIGKSSQAINFESLSQRSIWRHQQ